MSRTQTLIEQAMKHPELDAPGECAYVRKAGNVVRRCIVGTVLHLAGVGDRELEAGQGQESLFNTCQIDERQDLLFYITANELDLKELMTAQMDWDGQLEHDGLQHPLSDAWYQEHGE